MLLTTSTTSNPALLDSDEIYSGVETKLMRPPSALSKIYPVPLCALGTCSLLKEIETEVLTVRRNFQISRPRPISAASDRALDRTISSDWTFVAPCSGLIVRSNRYLRICALKPTERALWDDRMKYPPARNTRATSRKQRVLSLSVRMQSMPL